MKKGFTLIEIIGVIIIIGLLVIVAVPYFTSSLNTFRDDYYANLANTVNTSGKEFFNDYQKLLPHNSLETQKVLISTLENEKYIENVLDYNNDKCDDTSFIRVINLGKEGYKYVPCLKCSKDNYETISENDECNSWWDTNSGIKSTFGNPDTVYIYKGSTREELLEKTVLKADLVKMDDAGTIVGRVKDEGDNSLNLMPVNLDSVDLDKVGEYELKYVNGNVTLIGKVVVYENISPGLKFEKVDASSDADTGTEIDLTPGKDEWAQKLIIRIDEGISAKYSETGIKIAMYQWNRGGRWKNFCEPEFDKQGCTVRVAEEIDKERVRFRAIDENGNISVETVEYELRIDSTKPKCELKAEGEQNNSGIFITPSTVSFKTYVDQGSVQSGVKQYGIDSLTGAKTITHDEETLTGVTYTGYITDYANNTSMCSITVKQKKIYVLTYNNNSGSGCTKKDIIYSKPYGNLCTPSKQSYIFVGWFTQTSGGTEVTKNTIHSEAVDKTIYARWKANTYTVTFNGNGATGGSTASQTCTIDANCTLNGNGFSRTNYTFAGWATSRSGGVYYSNRQTVKNIATGGGNITLYAKWAVAVTNYEYTGGVQSFTASYSGTYRLEVWGAQGGNYYFPHENLTIPGGNGGYAIGNKYLNAGQTIYIVVGGSGSVTYSLAGANGGYNGGGNGGRGYQDNGGGGGGGATHIATTNRGVLSNYNSYRNELLIVAGGGGGACNHSYPGTGGGVNGGNSLIGSDGNACSSGGGHAAGGTQTSGYAFGQGQSAPPRREYGNCGSEGKGGGGGGYYGGRVSTNGDGDNTDDGGGGGSGYTGGVTSGSMQNGVQTGNGYARITFMG